jgi:hypothetical protein
MLITSTIKIVIIMEKIIIITIIMNKKLTEVDLMENGENKM